MNRRDFLKQLGLIATLPLIPGLFQSTHTIGGWFKPDGGKWEFATYKCSYNEAVKFPTKVTYLDGQVAMVFVCGPPALPDEQIEALYQQTRQWFEV